MTISKQRAIEIAKRALEKVESSQTTPKQTLRNETQQENNKKQKPQDKSK